MIHGNESRRCQLEVMSDILEVLRIPSGITRIISEDGKFSYIALKIHMDEMIERKFIVKNELKVYSMTDKGRKFADMLLEMKEKKHE